MQGNDPIDDRIVSKNSLETLEQYLNRVPVQKRYYGLTFFALDKNNELRKYTFQTSLIEPTIDDDEEEIERIDKELQEHVSNKAIHKTSEEIRSEIVDADIPDTIARVQWTLDQINTAVINLIGGASDEYNTLKRIQTKIEELRAKIYGDDGGTVLKTLEQALKFLNQYKDFIVDIPENFVNKQDIVDNLTTDDPTKVLSAKQGKILSDTLTNYFESAMQSIRTETDRAINAENRIETKLDKEIDRSIKEDQRIDAKLDAEIKRSTDEDLRIDSKLDSEINRSTTEDDRLDKKIDAETTRATTVESNLNTKIETETDRAEGEESRIETKLDNEITRSTNKDTEHDNRLQALEGQTHEQNTDLGTTNSTFQLKYNTGNKIKHESDAISVRNAADTDYVNFIAKNATFKGDLLVEGQSFVTEAETVEIKDNLLLLNKGEVGAGVTKGIAGLDIDRGTEPNYQIIFDESDNRFKAGEIGDIQCLALRDGDDSMTGGMFTSWDSTTKRLKTTNIVPSSSLLYFGDNKKVALSYNNSEGLSIYNGNNTLAIFPTANNTTFRCTGNNFQLVGKLITLNETISSTFRRVSDNSEVLYHADIVNNLTSGGTSKVLSAEQGKLLQNSITSIQGSYLPLSGGKMTGSIRFPSEFGIIGNADGTNDTYILRSFSDRVDIGANSLKTRIISNNNDIIHNRGGSEYKIWDESNLTNPVRYSLDSSNGYPTLLNSAGDVFSYIKTGPGGIIPNTPVSLVSGGSCIVGNNTWSFNSAYINNIHINKMTFGNAGAFIDNQSGDSSHIGIGFYTSQNAACPVYVGSLCVSDGYANSAPNIPTNGIYSKGNIRTNGWISFTNNAWTDEGGAYKEEDGSLKVLIVPTDSSQPKPSTYGSVLQFNSRKNHWCTQIWSDQVNSTANPSNGKLRYRTTKSYATTEWNPWTAIATEDYVSSNYLPLSGGTITSSGLNPVYINSTSNQQSALIFHINSSLSAVVGGNKTLGAFLQDGSNAILTVKSDGAYYGVNTNSLRKLATVTDLNNYLPLTGGALSGTLTINTVGDQTLIINNNDTNGIETLVKVLRKGTPQAAIGFYDGLGAYVYNYNARKYLFIDNDGYVRVGTTSASTRLALITDIPSISGYLPLSGGTLTGALTMDNRKNNVVVDVVAGTGNNWNGGAGALSVQVPSDNGQTPLILARRSGATINTTTLSERLLDMALLDKGTIFRVGMSGAVALELEVTSFTNKVGIGKLFGKTIATTDQIPSLSGYATQSWANSQFAPLKNYFVTGNYASIATTGNEMCIGSLTSGNSVINVNYRNGTGTTSPSTWYWRAGSSTTWANAYWGNLYMNNALVATQSWASGQFPTKTGAGASGTWGISITGNADTATNSTQLGGTAASSYVKANDNISRLTNDSGYTTQEWVNEQGFLTSDSLLDKFVPTTGGYIRNSDQVLLRIQRTGFSTGTRRTIEMYFDDSNTDGTSITSRGSIGYDSEAGMFLYSAASKKFLAIENTGKPFYGTPENKYYLLGSNTQYHNLDGYQRIGDIMIQWGYFTVQGNSTRAVNFPVSFTNTVWSVTGSWDNTATGNQENWGFTDYTSSGFTIINGDGSSRVFHYIAIGPFTRS